MIDFLVRYYKEKRERKEKAALTELKARYHAFRIFLENNGRALELIVKIDGQLSHNRKSELRPPTEELLGVTSELVDGLNLLSGYGYTGLYSQHGILTEKVNKHLDLLEKTPTAATPFCTELSLPLATDAAQFGKKAATLAQLRQMSLPVPDGFVCSTASCEYFLKETGLTIKIANLLKLFDNNQEDRGAVAENIKELILATPLPAKIKEALDEAFARLIGEHVTGAETTSPVAVSVRSSGVSEDGADFSFAGQYTSILNVQGTDALFRAYREVIASAFSTRAMSYRQNAGMSRLDFDLAVFCQVMIDADCAGVLFTHDPSQPDSGRMMISAVPGLGTSAVGGSVPVDLYYPPRLETVCIPHVGITERTSNDQITTTDYTAHLMDSAEISHKTLREVPAAGGGLLKEAFPDEKADLPLLSLEALEELARLGTIIESLEQGPQDVEWAWSQSTGISILQARPLRLAAANEGECIWEIFRH